ncbi:hypothetical protein WS62_23530 [Burkholderia sp. ABCPW 14]|uniref:lytic transglycosylase domain-containing protein n=1 Tax=Burkholderia sp. ABCPW 14 TaxID=1637860 RepID=UPI000770DAB8|nr:lytic transglycosylase domain-containing protein [Burkholderia sp. ABCPW 14]KVD81931.1 hypothetical protein WS62_23530 [Burkholderia sp. ABCPW 14]
MAGAYNASAFPVSYRDPAYDQADQAASAAVGIPAQLLMNIRTKGEKSNADQISSAGAATPYQITPGTRDAIIKQTGVDPWLNPQTASYGAAYLLKQSMDRNGGNPVLATAEYHGGTDRDAWGPKTMAYVKRVAGMSPNNPDVTNPYAVQALPGIGTAPGALQPTPQGSQPSPSNPYAVAPLPNIGAAPGAVDSGPSGLQLAYDAYQSGRMSPEDSAQFEQDVQGGRIVLPAGMNVKAAPQPPMAPQQAVDAFNTGRMSPEDAQQFQQDVNSGALALPHGAVLTPQQPETAGRVAGIAARGFLQGAATSWQNAVQTAANPTKVPLPIAVINQLMQSAPQVADQIFGTHLASNVTPQQAVEQSGLPRAQNAGEQIVQQGAEGAGGMAVPLGALSTIPKMIAAGAAGGTVGEAVHQATGNHMLGVAANLLTTALSPVAASRVMAALARELPQAGAAAAAQGGETAAASQAAPEASTSAAASSAPSSLGTRLNPGTPEVPSPTVASLQQERESLLPVAANAPAKGDTSIQDQISALEGRSFDSIAERTKELQARGMKFGDARALAQKQIAGEMSGYQDQMQRLQSQMEASQAGSRALQRIQEIDAELAQTAPTAPAARNPIAAASSEAFSSPGLPNSGAMARMQEGRAQEAAAGAAQAPEGGYVGAQETAGGTYVVSPEELAAAQRAQRVNDALAASNGEQAPPSTARSVVNPAASPLASAAQDFMSSDELAAQMRKATGSAPFGIGKKTAREVLASQASPDPETLKAAKYLGIEDNLQPDHLTSNQAFRELAQAIKSTPGSLSRSQEMEGLQAVGQRAQQLVDDLGGTRDLSGLSGQVKGELMNTQQQLDQKAEGLYQSLRDTVPAKMGVDASNVLDFIKQRTDDLGGAKNLSPIERMIQSKLAPRELPVSIGGQEVSSASLGMKPQMQQPTYALLDDIRKSIGSGLRNQGPFKDADQGLLKALYGRISEDQRGALSTIPGALEQFDAARAAVQMRKSVEDDMTSLFGKHLGDSLVGKLGTAMAVLPKGDEVKFVALMKSVPPGMRQQVTASGLAYAFGKATKNGELNFKTYADWMDGLKKNPSAFNAVMGNLPDEGRQQLLALAKVSRGIANATRENITTGRIMAAREELAARADGMIAKIMNAARSAAIGKVGTVVSAAAAHVGGPVGAGISHALMSGLSKGKVDVLKEGDGVLVSPEFQQYAKKGASATQQEVTALANSPQFRHWFDFARDTTAANDQASRVRWILGTLNAAESASNINSNGNR